MDRTRHPPLGCHAHGAQGRAAEHIERVLGHVVQGVAGTYNRYSYLDEKRAALEAWGQLWKA